MTVDELNQCNQRIGQDDSENRSSNFSIWSSMGRNRSKPRRFFPFKKGYLSVMTLRAGEEGVHMTVDGRHATSFAFREVINHLFSLNLLSLSRSNCLFSLTYLLSLLVIFF